MSTNKKKKKNAGPPLPVVRLSQCMIVKNEERNIERALSWAKRIAYEQIVVDTGSTDRTVEIAKRMGAKVYHFEWIKDFAAAKNYAIEQATGNWIAFLDADEYFTPIDTQKLMVYLKKIQTHKELREEYQAIMCTISQVDDSGKPIAVMTQARVFRNLPEVRYTGRIHERLDIDYARMGQAETITIIHTGYAQSAYEETGKAERNVEMLRTEMALKPDDLSIKIYYADSLNAAGGEDNVAEAMALYREVIDSDHSHVGGQIKSAYLPLLDKLLQSDENLSECESMCRKGLEVMPGDMDFEYVLAVVMNRKKEYQAAWDLLKGVEEKLLNARTMDEARLITAKPDRLFGMLALVAQSLHDDEGIIRYAAMLLTGDKSRYDVLCSYIAILFKNGVSTDEVVGLLERIYVMDDPQDLLLISKAAKDVGAIDFARELVAMIKT